MSGKKSSYQKLGKTSVERTMNYQRECDGCGAVDNFVGTWKDGDKFCKDCVNEGKQASRLLTERNNHLKAAAKLELELEDMGYSEQIGPDYEHYLRQENRQELEQSQIK